MRAGTSRPTTKALHPLWPDRFPRSGPARSRRFTAFVCAVVALLLSVSAGGPAGAYPARHAAATSVPVSPADSAQAAHPPAKPGEAPETAFQAYPTAASSAELPAAAPGFADVPENLAAGSRRPRVAVVLGGGAARGFSHIGLLKALEENGVPVDILVGTSMGSIVAGLYAAGLSVDNLTYLVTQVDLSRFFSPRIPPRGGLVDTGRFELFISELTNGARVESLPIPYYSIVVDLQNGREVALNHGPLGRAIVASMAIPGMFPPVEIDGVHYADGGLLSIVPVRAAREAGADFIIAVDVSRRPGRETDFEDVFANVQMALDVLLDRHEDQIRAADVLVTPDVADTSYMEYDRAAYFIEEGYRAAMEVMDDIRAGLLRLDPDLPLGVPRRQEGIGMERFVQVVERAAARAAIASARTPVVLPAVAVRPGRPPYYAADVRVPVGGSRRLPPWFVEYTLAGDGERWHHGLGVGAGYCTRLCLTLFAVTEPGADRWIPGVSVAGTIGAGSTPSPRSAAWTARWESGPSGHDNDWLLQLRLPAQDAITVVGRELVVGAGRDAKGLFAAPDSRPRAEAVYRRYFLGEPRNLWELLRGGVHWYVGVGGGVAWPGGAASSGDGARADAAASTGASSSPAGPGAASTTPAPGRTSEDVYVYPVFETGLFLEAHLFGLHTMRGRLALTYEGGPDATWYLRLSFGD